MKICLIADPKFVHTQKWAKYFVDNGHEVHTISYSNVEIEGVILHSLISQNNSFHMNTKGMIKIQRDRLKLHLQRNKQLYNFRQTLRELSHKLNNFRLGLKCRQIIRRIKPDIIHGHGLVNHAFFAAMAGFKPLIVSAWGSDVLLHATKDNFYRIIAYYAAKNADLITTDSIVVEKKLEDIGIPKGKIITFPWGIDCELFSPGYRNRVKRLKQELNIHDNSLVVLSNRSAAALYNVKGIISSISGIVGSHPNVVFIFLRGYGTLEYEKEMIDEVSRLGVMNNTRFISRLISQEEMATFYNMSDLVVSIPHSDSMPVSVREGMACGCIPILSDIKANRELIKHGENGFLVKDDGGKSLASIIIYCLDNLAALKRKIGPVNREFIIKYHSWGKTTEIMKEIYLRLIDRYKTKGQNLT